MKQNMYIAGAICLVIGFALGGWLGAAGKLDLLPFNDKGLRSSANFGGDDPCTPEIIVLLDAYKTGSLAKINAAQAAAAACFKANPVQLEMELQQ